MPNYLFLKVNSRPKEYSERFYHMNEAPSIGAVIKDENGVRWRRVATKPQASFDTKVDPYSSKDFVKATNKPGTLGDLWDRAAESSQKRADKDGIDPIQEKFYDDYSKRRKGKKHPDQVRREKAKELKKQGITIEWGD